MGFRRPNAVFSRMSTRTRLGVGLVALLLVAAAGVTWFTVGPPAQEANLVPQAASSAPEPTLVAVGTIDRTGEPGETAPTDLEAATPGATEAPSPFAGIAAPPPAPPQRTGTITHT